MYLSKSDYIKGINCIKWLWLKKNRKDLIPEYSSIELASFAIGDIAQDMARDYYPGGVMVEAPTDDVEKGAELTKELSKKHQILYEATAKLPNGCFCRIDVLIKNGRTWDLIEIKSANKVKPYYIDDLAFQKYVFENAGYKVKNCKVLHLNKDYVRHGELNIKELFKEEDVTDAVNKKFDDIEPIIKDMLRAQVAKKEPNITLHATCLDCSFYHYCGKDMPEYSVFDLLSKKAADEFYQKHHSAEIKDLPIEWCSTKKQLIDYNSYVDDKIHAEPKLIKEWLAGLEYPLYYFDYETVSPPIPLFDNSYPYLRIPFQFSLHIQKELHGKLEHVEYLHQENSDPRRSIAETLVKNCGKKGSVIVYYQSFEKGRNEELAELFPDLRDDILAINERVVDLCDPFKKQLLYSPKQKGSASIKDVLPAFTDLSYKGMAIANGDDAMMKYLAFLNDAQTADETKQMFEDLLKYCEQDTLAMVLLMDVLYEWSEK